MTNIRLSDAISEFAGYAQGAYKDGTRRGQRSSLDGLLTEIGNIWTRNITAIHIDRYIAARKASGVTPLTIRNNLTHVKMFCEFARARKFCPPQWDPVGRRRTVKTVPFDYAIIPVEEFGLLLDSADHARDRAMIAFGLYTMCRQSELGAARIRDLDLEDGWVTINVLKSGVLDRMPVSAELNVEMLTWLRAYRQSAGPLMPHWKLFPALVVGGHGRNAKGQLLPVPNGLLRLRPEATPSKIHWGVQHALARMGRLHYKEGLHTLRRSAARARFDQLVNEGYDGALREVQALLHHKNTATTEHYLGLTQAVRRRDNAIRGHQMFGTTAPLRAVAND